MRDYPAPLSKDESLKKLKGYLTAKKQFGFTRQHVSTPEGEFLGYTGLMRQTAYPIKDHVEIGWRYLPKAWGQGIATEAAKTVLCDAFQNIGLNQVLAYTAPENLASQAVMMRLGLVRRTDLDFTIEGGDEDGWRGSVWEARPEQFKE